MHRASLKFTLFTLQRPQFYFNLHETIPECLSGLCWSDLFKPCSASRGHSFASIFINSYQNVFLSDISQFFNMGHVGSKTRSLGQMS